MLGRCAGTGIGRTGTLRAGASGTDPKGPDLSNSSMFARVNAENWLVRTVRGGSGNTDKSRMRISYRKDFNKTWYQYAITVRPVVPAPSDPFAEVVSVSFLPTLVVLLEVGSMRLVLLLHLWQFLLSNVQISSGGRMLWQQPWDLPHTFSQIGLCWCRSGFKHQR